MLTGPAAMCGSGLRCERSDLDRGHLVGIRRDRPAAHRARLAKGFTDPKGHDIGAHAPCRSPTSWSTEACRYPGYTPRVAVPPVEAPPGDGHQDRAPQTTDTHPTRPPDADRIPLVHRIAASAGVREPRLRSWRRLKLAGVVVMGLWFCGLAAFSTLIYHRAFLGQDFATYNQAWSQIGSGHLDPFDTVYGFPFVKADFELILWPLALLHLVTSQSIVLLFVQDLAVAGTGLVAYLWIIEFLERKEVPILTATAVGALVLVVTVANPGIYQTVRFDVHMEPIAALFLVLAGRDFWRGRIRRAWIWSAVVLLCGSFAAIALFGLGLSAVLAGKRTRRSGVILVTASVGWLALISALGADRGSGLSLYAYLAGRNTLSGAGGLAVLAGGIVTHPWRVADHVFHRLGAVYQLIKPVGIVGLASAWGFGVPVVVLATNALNSRTDFLNNAFQNCAVFPFVTVGTVMVLVWLAERVQVGWVIALVVALAVTAQALTYGFTRSPADVRWAVHQVPSGPASQLRAALSKVPQGAEVISTLSVMGRFCSREYCYFFYPNGPRPVAAHDVVFVFAADNETLTTPAGSAYAISYVRDRLHARVLVDAQGIAAFDWHPAPGVRQVTLPTGPAS